MRVIPRRQSELMIWRECRDYSQTPQQTMMKANQSEGLVLFIMMLLGISAATYQGKKTARATCKLVKNGKGTEEAR